MSEMFPALKAFAENTKCNKMVKLYRDFQSHPHEEPYIVHRDLVEEFSVPMLLDCINVAGEVQFKFHCRDQDVFMMILHTSTLGRLPAHFNASDGTVQRKKTLARAWLFASTFGADFDRFQDRVMLALLEVGGVSGMSRDDLTELAARCRKDDKLYYLILEQVVQEYNEREISFQDLQAFAKEDANFWKNVFRAQQKYKRDRMEEHTQYHREYLVGQDALDWTEIYDF